MKLSLLFRLSVCAALSSLQIAATASAENLYANVAIGGLIGGNGVTSVTQLGIQYEVTFSSDVSDCAYLATTANAYGQAIRVFTAGGHLSANGVFIEIKNQGGGLLDGPFHLSVICKASKLPFAVVGYSADLVRAAPGTKLSHLGPGRYNISFGSSVESCAYLATVGDPENAFVFEPSGVYTGSGANSKTVNGETKTPGGELADGIPFHLGVVCPGAPKTHFAVVKDTGHISRGSLLTSSYRSSTGTYAMVASADVSPDCASIATRGSIDNNAPSGPATVEIIPGPAPNTVGVEVRSLISLGSGDVIDEEFHVASFCK